MRPSQAHNNLAEFLFANSRPFCLWSIHACSYKHLHVSVTSYRRHALHNFLQLSYEPVWNMGKSVIVYFRLPLTSHSCVVPSTQLKSVNTQGQYPPVINHACMCTCYLYDFPLINLLFTLRVHADTKFYICLSLCLFIVALAKVFVCKTKERY